MISKQKSLSINSATELTNFATTFFFKGFSALLGQTDRFILPKPLSIRRYLSETESAPLDVCYLTIPYRPYQWDIEVRVM